MIIKDGLERASSVSQPASAEGALIGVPAPTLSRGQIAAMERANQLLPWRTDVLSPVMYDRLTKQLQAFLFGVTAREKIYEPAAAAMAASLFTGRPISTFYGLKRWTIATPVPAEDDPEGFYITPKGSVWWLSAGRPKSRQIQRPEGESQARAIKLRVILRCGHLTEELVDNSIRAQFGKRYVNRSPAPLFSPKVQKNLPRLCLELLKLFKLQNDCSTTMKRIESWLFQRVVEETGDPAIAKIITGRESAMSASTLHYSAVSRRRAWVIHARIVEGMDIAFPADPDPFEPHADFGEDLGIGGHLAPPAELQKGDLGSKYVPKQAQVQALSKSLRSSLADARALHGDFQMIEKHRLMTLYTVALVGFATGMRKVRDPIPSLKSIDRSTGFVLIDDKRDGQGPRTRLSWLAPAAYEQIIRYDRHLQALEKMLARRAGTPSGRVIAELRERKPDRLPIFLLDDCAQIVPAKVTDIASAFASPAVNFHLPMNAWRHYVRTALAVILPGDVVHAFLGHWHRGQEPWSDYSALDPMVYRDYLETALVPLLAHDGWEPESGLVGESTEVQSA